MKFLQKRKPWRAGWLGKLTGLHSPSRCGIDCWCDNKRDIPDVGRHKTDGTCWCEGEDDER